MLIPHQFYYYFQFGSFFNNFLIARIEGMRNATYSFEKIYQALSVFGPFTLCILLYSIIKSNLKFLSLFVLTGLLLVPFNPDNPRFFLPILSFVIIILLNFVTTFAPKAKSMVLILLFIETFVNCGIWRSQIINSNERNLTEVELTSSFIKNNLKQFTEIITNYNYPDFALHTGLKINVPLQQVGNDNDFHFILPALAKNHQTLIITKSNGFPNPEFLNAKNFPHIKSIYGFELFAIPHSENLEVKVFKASVINTKLEKYPHGIGFLKLGRNHEVIDLHIEYRPQRIIPKKYVSCFRDHAIIVSPQSAKITITQREDKTITLNVIPKLLGSCENSDVLVVQVIFDKINH